MEALKTMLGGGAKVAGAGSSSALPPVQLLVIQSDAYDWGAIMKDRRLRDGRGFRVVQTSWRDLMVGPCSSAVRDVPVTSVVRRKAQQQQQQHSDPHRARSIAAGITPDAPRRCEVTCTVLKEWVDGKAVDTGSKIVFTPDFVLVREEVTTPTFQAGRNQLLGLIYANVPSVNSLRSILMFCDKPVVQGALNAVATTRFVGREDAFPLIPQDFFPSGQGFFYGRGFPAVVKFGTAHAGYGKIRIKHHHDMDDIRGILPMTADGYCTAEPLIERSGGDYRLQKIGGTYRAFKRIDVSGAWKTNTGSAVLHEVPVTPRFKEMMDAAAGMFMPPGGGEDTATRGAAPSAQGHPDYLDILTVDLIVELPPDVPYDLRVPPPMPNSDVSTATATLPGFEVDHAFNSDNDKVWVLEVNGTSSGLGPDHGAVDNAHIADLVVGRMDALYCDEE